MFRVINIEKLKRIYSQTKSQDLKDTIKVFIEAYHTINPLDQELQQIKAKLSQLEEKYVEQNYSVDDVDSKADDLKSEIDDLERRILDLEAKEKN
ncbi:MAG: hypothetical protein V1494_07200 [Candidatus Diapherotrites archaeon]